jgi:hypothetical protein
MAGDGCDWVFLRVTDDSPLLVLLGQQKRM